MHCGKICKGIKKIGRKNGYTCNAIENQLYRVKNRMGNVGILVKDKLNCRSLFIRQAHGKMVLELRVKTRSMLSRRLWYSAYKQLSSGLIREQQCCNHISEKRAADWFSKILQDISLMLEE